MGARHPLCSAESLSCPSPRNVPWIVEHEASNLTDPHGKLPDDRGRLQDARR